MSRFARCFLSAAVAGVLTAGSAAGQLLPGIPLPSVSVPAPVGNLPVAGPVLQDLLAQPEVFFEAGDHQQLVHMSGDQFADLMAGAEHGRFSRHMM